MVMGDDLHWQRQSFTSSSKTIKHFSSKSSSIDFESEIDKQQYLKTSPHYEKYFKRIYRPPLAVEYLQRQHIYDVSIAKYNLEGMKQAGIKPIF